MEAIPVVVQVNTFYSYHRTYYLMCVNLNCCTSILNNNDQSNQF